MARMHRAKPYGLSKVFTHPPFEAMALAGLSACPGDAFADVREKAHIVCAAHGGQGAFRELAEILIAAGTQRPA